MTELRSHKPLKSLIDIIQPFKAIFDEPICGSVNGRNFAFPANQEVELTYPEFEDLFFAGKIKVE
jgi:hypothetical protein